MSNHYSAANLRFPGDDARLDLTDLYVFPAADPGKTVVIIDVNPFATGMSAMPPFLMRSDFHPDGVYRINVDRDGDAQAEAAFTFTFSERVDGVQTGTVFYATGAEARQPEPGGEVLIDGTPVAFDDASARPVLAGQVRLFIGVRSEPFFADADGSFHGFQWTGKDAFADKNILSIVMEVPHDMLGADPAIGLWASVSQRHRDGSLVQVDRGGHPTINPFVNPNNVKNTYNLGQPVDDLANYLGPLVQVPARQRRLLPRGGGQGGPHRAAGHPPLRPQQAGRVPERARDHRRRLQPALRLDVGRQDPAAGAQAARRSAGRVPLPGSAQPLPGLTGGARRSNGPFDNRFLGLNSVLNLTLNCEFRATTRRRRRG